MNMEIMDKKAIERYYLRKFISDPALGLRVKNIEDSETPDFIVQTIDSTISIELTQLIDPKLKEHEVFQRKVVRSAMELFQTKNTNVTLDVLVTFSKQFKYQKSNPDTIAFEICEEVNRVYQFNKDFDFRIATPSGRRFKRLSYVDRLLVSTDGVFQTWQPVGAHMVDYIDPEWMAGVVKRKESALSKYRHQYDQSWLLMVCDFGYKSSAFRFEKIRSSRMATDFDRVFVFQHRDDGWFEL